MHRDSPHRRRRKLEQCAGETAKHQLGHRGTGYEARSEPDAVHRPECVLRPGSRRPPAERLCLHDRQPDVNAVKHRPTGRRLVHRLALVRSRVRPGGPSAADRNYLCRFETRPYRIAPEQRGGASTARKGHITTGRLRRGSADDAGPVHLAACSTTAEVVGGSASLDWTIGEPVLGYSEISPEEELLQSRN